MLQALDEVVVETLSAEAGHHLLPKTSPKYSPARPTKPVSASRLPSIVEPVRGSEQTKKARSTPARLDPRAQRGDVLLQPD